MMVACGFAEDGKRRKKSWSIERRALRQLKWNGERMSRRLSGALSRLAEYDLLTRTRIRESLWGLFGGDTPPPPLLPV